MSDKTTFRAFLLSNGVSGVRRVALDYAKSDDSVTLASLMEKYNLSSRSIRELLDYAVVNCIISYQDSVLMPPPPGSLPQHPPHPGLRGFGAGPLTSTGYLWSIQFYSVNPKISPPALLLPPPPRPPASPHLCPLLMMM